MLARGSWQNQLRQVTAEVSVAFGPSPFRAVSRCLNTQACQL